MSTVGVVPGMHRLRDFPLPVTLAVSLHAPDDALRDELVPLNRRYPIAEVLDAAREYAAAKGRRVTFEYACIEGVERPSAPGRRARRSPTRLPRGRAREPDPAEPARPDSAVPRPAPSASHSSRTACAERGVQVSIRRNRGVDIDAACGQLRARMGPVRRAAVTIGHNGP